MCKNTKPLYGQPHPPRSAIQAYSSEISGKTPANKKDHKKGRDLGIFGRNIPCASDKFHLLP